MKSLSLISVAVVLSGCGTIFAGTSQEIAVNTSPTGASCEFFRNNESIGLLAKTPGKLTVSRRKQNIIIKCDKPGYQQAEYVNKSGYSGNIAGNVAADLILTAGISSIVDSASGADNEYEKSVTIVLTPIEPSGGAGAAPGT